MRNEEDTCSFSDSYVLVWVCDHSYIYIYIYVCVCMCVCVCVCVSACVCHVTKYFSPYLEMYAYWGIKGNVTR